MNEEANKKIHTYLGKCWHESGRHRSGISNGVCVKCGVEERITPADYGEPAVSDWVHPDYFTDHKAAREFWSKVCETEDREAMFGFALCLELDKNHHGKPQKCSTSQRIAKVALVPVEVGTKAACRAAGIEVEG